MHTSKCFVTAGEYYGPYLLVFLELDQSIIELLEQGTGKCVECPGSIQSNSRAVSLHDMIVYPTNKLRCSIWDYQKTY